MAHRDVVVHRDQCIKIQITVTVDEATLTQLKILRLTEVGAACQVGRRRHNGPCQAKHQPADPSTRHIIADGVGSSVDHVDGHSA
ncbi:MAG: hypothetical protein LC799_12795 [Actinobacteria bacterium]|nr:hypothetical protein [Actinomycetota bacterium]